MKYLSSILIILCFILSSCHNNDSTPPTETMLPVVKHYVPTSVKFQRSDKEFFDKAKAFSQKTFIVNSVHELPSDPIGFSNAYHSINFKDNTLLVTYGLHSWLLETCSNTYYRDNVEKTYNWAIRMGTSYEPDPESEYLYFTRFALLVNKVPQDTEVIITPYVSALGWDWDE